MASSCSVAIVGGGLAGIAAAHADDLIGILRWRRLALYVSSGAGNDEYARERNHSEAHIPSRCS